MSDDDWFKEISVCNSGYIPIRFWSAGPCVACVYLLEYPASGTIAACQSVIVWICEWYESETYGDS